MPIDTKTPETAGWWLARLDKKRLARLPRLEKLDRYYRGDPPLPEGAANARSAYQAFQKKARLNLAELIVGSLRERMRVRAIRTAVASDENGDAQAWAMFRANGLEVEFSDVLENMLALGDAYMIVGVDPDAEDPFGPSDVWITGEDPRQVVTIHDPVRQSRVRAAAKFFHDPERERDYAYLYLPGQRFVASRNRRTSVGGVRFSPQSWDWDEGFGGADGEPVPGDLVPVVRFRNRRGVGEYEPHLDVLDRINHMILQRMVIATMQAFKQRAIKGDLPTHYPVGHPQAGLEIDYNGMFEADPGALWMIPGAAEIWESGQVDLTGILSAVQDDIKHLAAVTRRSLRVYAPDNESAAAATEDGAVSKFVAEDRCARAGQALAQVMHLAFLARGDVERARVEDIETDWMPVERFALAARGSAAQQARAAGMSQRGILEHVWQLDPSQIDRELADQASDALTRAVFDLPDDEPVVEPAVQG